VTFFHPRTGHAGLLSRPGRDFLPGDAPGIHIPFAVLLRSAGETVFRHLEPTCRFALRPPRVSSSRSTPAKACRWAFGRGFWVTVRGSAVPCFSPAPPWLLCTGSLELTSQDCPGFYFLSQVFDAGRRSPPLEPFRPWAFDPNRAALLQRNIAKLERALRRFKWPTPSQSGGVSVRISILSEVFAPSANRSPARAGAIDSRLRRQSK